MADKHGVGQTSRSAFDLQVEQRQTSGNATVATSSPVKAPPPATPTAGRIDSMDQFRGYTMAGMFLVNFVGAFAAIHPVFKHHNNYNSYADTIMPHFFFAVGFAFRLVLLRNIEKMGSAGAAYRKAINRCLSLALVGLVVYGLDGRYKTWADLTTLGWSGFLNNSFWRTPFQALVHIAVTSLWVLPVIAASARVRIIFLVASAGLHLALSHWFWYDLLWAKRVIDGGPLGFLTWAIPTILGSFAYDFVRNRGPRAATKPLLAWGAGLALFGYALSCLNAIFNTVKPGGIMNFLAEPPFWPPTRPVDLWTMSQRAGANSYLWFATGLSLLVYAFFVWWTDIKGHRVGMFRTFGINALAGYIIHDLVSKFVRPFAPADSPLYWSLLMFAVFFGIVWLFLIGLDKQRIYLRM
jgi:predicted acyltransferase